MGEHEALWENFPKLQQGLENDEKQSVSFFFVGKMGLITIIKLFLS